MLPQFGYLSAKRVGERVVLAIVSKMPAADKHGRGWWVLLKDGWSGPWGSVQEAHEAKRTSK